MHGLCIQFSFKGFDMTHAAPAPSATPEITPETADLIRSVMIEQKRETKRNMLPELEPADPGLEHEQDLQSEPTQPTPKTHTARQHPQSLKKRIKSYRPTPKHLAIAALVLVVWFRPWLIPGILFVGFWIGLIAYLTLGPDRSIEIASDVWSWISRKSPRTANRLRQGADAFALKFDALLDRLPDRWAEKLSLPDLSQPATQPDTLDDLPDPFEKLKLPEVYRG